jgi:hypothetical protein
MRYITATIGAVVIFVLVVFLCACVCAVVLPEKVNHMKITMYLGQLRIWATPSFIIGGPLAVGAAILTFRGTLRAYRNVDQQPPDRK